MKIGIITFWQTRDNYGQMLQCLALQQKLLQMGHTPFLIRYTHSEHKNPWQDQCVYFFKALLRLRFRNLFLRQKFLPALSERDSIRRFDMFKSECLLMSEQIYESLSDLRKNPPSADCYIAGSDQVWSKTLRWIENRVFFLDFGSPDTLRMSYATSFGMESYPPKINNRLKRCLETFDAISVREKKGVDICQAVGVKAELVVDPTMLFDEAFYKDYFHIRNLKQHNLFIYSLNISSADEIRWKEVKKYAESSDLNIVVTPSSGYIPADELFGDETDYKYSTIPEWIGCIAGSELVITTSFHGVVFCLLFHTRFIYVPLKGRFSKGNNRVLDLLKEIGVKGRVLEDDLSVEQIDSKQIDWNKVDRELERMRQKSIIFIDKSLTSHDNL